MGVEAYKFASAFNCILAQRLVRPSASTAYAPFITTTNSFSPAAWIPPSARLQFPRGHWLHGVRRHRLGGRTAIHELLDLTHTIRKPSWPRNPPPRFRRQAQKEGMSFLRESAIERVRRGVISRSSAAFAMRTCGPTVSRNSPRSISRCRSHSGRPFLRSDRAFAPDA